MKKRLFVPIILILILAGCDSDETKASRLSTLTCEDSRVGRSKEELMAITDACFRRGSFVKSSGREW